VALSEALPIENDDDDEEEDEDEDEDEDEKGTTHRAQKDPAFSRKPGLICCEVVRRWALG
jgi:hypothetical protein